MSAAAARTARQRGFALVIVLWAVVLLSLVAGQIGLAARTQAQLAANIRRAATLQAAADAAIATAGFHLVSGAGPAWIADGRAYKVPPVTDDGVTRAVVVRVVDQAGKVDLNKAPVPLVQALLAATGADAATAAQLATAILAWRFPVGTGAPAAAVAAPYRRAGLDYAPPGLPFESMDELRLVVGVTPAIYAAILPHLTIWQVGGIDPALADPVVKRALAAGGPLAAGAAATPAPLSGNSLRVVEIAATAYGDAGAVARRDAVVELGPQKQGWMRVLTWRTATGPGD